LERRSTVVLPQTTYPTRVRRKRVSWEEREHQKKRAAKGYPTRVRRNFGQNRETLQEEGITTLGHELAIARRAEQWRRSLKESTVVIATTVEGEER